MSGKTVLTEDDIHDIIYLRTEKGYEVPALARRLNFRRETIRDVVTGRTWKHITGGPLEKHGQ